MIFGSAIKLLIAEDERNLGQVLQKEGARFGYQVTLVHDGDSALRIAASDEYDLALIDINMPGLSGLDLCEALGKQSPDTVVIVESGMTDVNCAVEAMRRGAFDYITKPFQMGELQTALQRALRHRLLLKANRQYRDHLQEMVLQRTEELSETNSHLSATYDRLYVNYRATLRALASALEARNIDTQGHTQRVVSYCLRLGRQIGLGPDDMISLEYGALLHDIGEIGVPDAILRKTGSLTEEDWSKVRRHVEYGAEIIRGIDFLEGASLVVAQHHERYDGSGYPKSLTGEHICIGARIFAVADTFDAMTSDRPYRKAYPVEVAAKQIISSSGRQFDPAVVNAFVDVPLEEWHELSLQAPQAGTAMDDNHIHRLIAYSVMTMSGDDLGEPWI